MKSIIKQQIEAVKGSTQRFFGAFCFSIALFAVVWYTVTISPHAFYANLERTLMFTFAFGFWLSILGKLLFEKFCSRSEIRPLFVDLALILLGTLTVFAWGDAHQDRYIAAIYGGLTFAMFLGIIYFADTTGISQTFSHLYKKLWFSIFVCGIISIGTSIAIFAFHSLIWEFGRLNTVMSINHSFIWIVLFGNLMLAAIPQNYEKITLSKLFKVFVLYVGLPVYLLLFAILHIHIMRIIFTWSFPSGQMQWFSSLASFFFIFFTLTLAPFKQESWAARIFTKYGGYFLIPIILVYFIAMGIRLNAHGLTTARYLSLTANSIALIFAIVSVLQNGKWLKQTFIIVMATAILITTTPLNMFDVPLRAQGRIMTQTLQRNNMLVAGEVVPNENISEEDQARIRSAFRYISRNDTRQRMPEFMRDGKNFDETFGFPLGGGGFVGPNARFSWASFRNNNFIMDTQGFRFVEPVRENGNIFEWQSSTIDLLPYAQRWHALHGEWADDLEMIIEFGDVKLILTSLEIQIETTTNSLSVSHFSGFILYN